MFKDKLKQLRENKNLSQQELADIVFVSRSAIAKWENGNGIPSSVNLKAICDYFGVEELWLLDRDELKDNVGEMTDKQKQIKIIFFASISFMFVFCLIIGGSYHLHRVAIIISTIYLVIKLLLKNTKVNKILCIITVCSSLFLSIVNWIATAIPEPTHFFRILAMNYSNNMISANELNISLSQLSSILNILMLSCINVLFLIICKGRRN